MGRIEENVYILEQPKGRLGKVKRQNAQTFLLKKKSIEK
jgi:hypothetical protein